MDDTDNEEDRCINCGVLLQTQKIKVSTLTPKCLEILIHWLENKNVSNYCLCNLCTEKINQYSESIATIIPTRQWGHTNICPCCGGSVGQQRPARVPVPLRPYAVKFWQWYSILKLPDNNFCCHKCLLRLKKLIVKDTENLASQPCASIFPHQAVEGSNYCVNTVRTNANKEVLPQIDPYTNNIILTDGVIRLANSSSKCLVIGCTGTTRKKITKHKHRLFSTKFNIFVPSHGRVCNTHLAFDDINHDNVQEKFLSRGKDFTVNQYETFVDEINEGVEVLDFENVEAMPDNICQYWTGLTVLQFLQMYEELNQPRVMKSALAVYLIRKITGDSLIKLAKVFNVKSVTLIKHTAIVEAYFQKKNE